MKFEMNLRGASRLTSQLKDKGEVDDVVKAVANNGAEMQKKAKRKAPVGTGNLKRKIGLDIDRAGFKATVTPETDYAMYVEYGRKPCAV